jgi:hypothetical protein
MLQKFEIDHDSNSISTLGKELNPSMWVMQDVLFDDESAKVVMSSLQQIKTGETNYQVSTYFIISLWISFCKSSSTKKVEL